MDIIGGGWDYVIVVAVIIFALILILKSRKK